MATTQVTVPVGSYTSLGTGTAGMTISATDIIEVIASTTQPANGAVGHPISAIVDNGPFFFSSGTQQVWAQCLGQNPCSVTVTV